MTRAWPAAAAAAFLAGLVFATAGCGDEDEGGGSGTADGAATEAPGPGDDARRGTEPGDATIGERGPSGQEEDVPGGPGDEIPATGPADFTGRGGRVAPRLVRVPPYLGVGVTLRSADGREYRLRIAGRTLRAGAGRRTASLRLEGLRPGRSYRGEVIGGVGGKVHIEASAEPGP